MSLHISEVILAHQCHCYKTGLGLTVTMELLTAYGAEGEIEVDIYETISGKYIDITADIAIAEDGIGLVFKVDVEAEKFKKYIIAQ